ncbi:hypothetical protein CDD83_7649 [Cordyceps sp. RAO-2017]|nr:hypothetical protein CDD83_7649 [Cordyceps sp. RAO-2017]
MSASPTTTATALPPELPPAEMACPSPRDSGLRTGPCIELVECEPMPNSSMLVLPTTRPPRARSCRTTVASKGEAWPRRMRDAHCVGNSAVAMLSLTASRNGRAPGSSAGPAVLPAAAAAAAAARQQHRPSAVPPA